MYTKNQLKQLREVIGEVVEQKLQPIRVDVNEIKVEQKRQGEVQSKQGKNIKEIRKDQKAMLNILDLEQMRQRKKLERLEKLNDLEPLEFVPGTAKSV